jgi:hypothetical protein
MRVFRDPDEGQWESDLATFAAGALGGLTLGILISRALPRPQVVTRDLKQHARSVARRLRPARLRRLAVEQEELDSLEDAVLSGFLDDQILGDRGIDIGAVSPGIIELSGSVYTEDEAHRAVSLASRIPGVRTVVNRLEVEDLGERPLGRRRLDEEELEATFMHQEGRVGGMGRRRQSPLTDPDRPDDSQYRKERALAAADRDQWEDEDLARHTPRAGQRPEVQSAARTRFSEDELDNQDPRGKRGDGSLDTPLQEFRSETRVGEGVNKATQMRLESSDVSQDNESERDEESRD